ncbi:hypothetical protein HK096_002736, partial [Nowakowskiella sp. JEL0078]
MSSTLSLPSKLFASLSWSRLLSTSLSLAKIIYHPISLSYHSNISNSLSAGINDASSLFEQQVRRTIESGLYPFSQATEDTFRSDQPFGNQTSYFDSPDGVVAANAITPTFGERYAGKLISLNHSTYLLAGYTGTAPPTLNADQQNTVDLTANVDPFFRPSYSLNSDVLSCYIAFDNGIMRNYPGSNGDRVRQFGAYDARQRSWYRDAKSYTSMSSRHVANATYVISDPYQDFQGRGYIVTISTTITNTGALVNGNTNAAQTEIGVAAINMFVNTVSQHVNKTAVKNSRTSLYVASNGIALSNPNWDPVTSELQRNFRYNDSVLPSIITSLQSSVSKNSTFTERYTDPAGTGDYLVVAKYLALTNGKTSSTNPYFVAISTFPMNVVDMPLQTVVQSMMSTLGIFIGVSLAIFIGVLLIVLLLVVTLANASVKPLVKLSEESAKISNNIGTSDLFNGVTRVKSQYGLNSVDETEELQRQFYEMVSKVKEASAKSQATTENVFFGDRSIPEWDPKKNSKSVVNSLPDLPPNYEQAKAEIEKSKVNTILEVQNEE